MTDTISKCDSTKGLSRRDVLGYAAVGLLVGGVLPAGRTAWAEEAKNPPSEVFLTRDISSEGVLKLFERIGGAIDGKVAIKLHVGDPGNRNYLSPDLVRGLCARVRGTLVDSNVFYGGPRAETESHKAVARQHGFDFADYDVLDSDGSVDLPIAGGKHLQSAKMGKGILDYDSLIVLSHFKGHAMAGFGGAVKNLAMGIASKEGKSLIHGGHNWRLNDEQTRQFLERLVEYGKGMADARKGKIVYINVLNNISVSCDCDSSAPAPSMADIGIMASTDIVAVEMASLDQVIRQANSEKHELIRQIDRKQGFRQIEYAEEIGMGRMGYTLIEV